MLGILNLLESEITMTSSVNRNSNETSKSRSLSRFNLCCISCSYTTSWSIVGWRTISTSFQKLSLGWPLVAKVVW